MMLLLKPLLVSLMFIYNSHTIGNWQAQCLPTGGSVETRSIVGVDPNLADLPYTGASESLVYTDLWEMDLNGIKRETWCHFGKAWCHFVCLLLFAIIFFLLFGCFYWFVCPNVCFYSAGLFSSYQSVAQPANFCFLYWSDSLVLTSPALHPLIWPHGLFRQSRLSRFEVDETIYHRPKTHQLPALKAPYLCPAPAAGHWGSGTS